MLRSRASSSESFASASPTSGGRSESDQNALTVVPKGRPFHVVVITVTGAQTAAMASLKASAVITALPLPITGRFAPATWAFHVRPLGQG